MCTLGRLALISWFVLPLHAQPKPVPRTPVPQAKPLVAKPVLPIPDNPPPAPDRIDKRRERMKDRDREIDRMLKQKNKH